MIGVLLVTHGDLGKEFLAVLNQIHGPQREMESVSIGHQDDMHDCEIQIEHAIARLNQGNGVIILTDLFGGTPSNIASKMLIAGEVEMISGLNLPMLIRLASIRKTSSLMECVNSIHEAGVKYINIVSELLKNMEEKEI